MHPAIRPLALAIAGAVVLSGCALVPPGSDTRPVPSATIAKTDAPVVPMQDAAVYFPRDSTTGLRLGREIRQVPRADPLRGVLELMIAGPLDPDYRSGWDAGTRVLTAATSGHVTTVDLSAEARTGSKFGSEGATAQLDQLVWTVTELAGADTVVDFRIDGQTPGELWGVTTWDAPRGREDALGVRVHVSIDSPNEGDAVTSPVRVSGDAAAHEANVPWVVRTDAGATVQEGHTSSEESMRFAPYAFEVSLEPGTYVVEVTGDDVGDMEGHRPDVDSRRFTVPG